MLFDRDREKLDRQKEEVMRIVEEYKENTLKKREDYEDHLQYLADTRDDILDLIEDCENAIKEKIQEDARKENIPDVDSTYVFLKDVDPSLTVLQYSGIEDIYNRVAHFLADQNIELKGF